MLQLVIPDTAEALPEDLTADLMTALLRGILVLLGFEWSVVLPFLSPNKTATACLLALVTVAILAVPYLLLRRHQIALAARSCLAGGALVGTILGLFGRGGVNNIGSTFQLAMVGLAIVILGWRWALWIAVPCLAADLASAVAESLGRPAPVLFHGSPLSAWVSITAFFTLMAIPMNRAVRILQHQLAERAKAEAAALEREERLRESRRMLEDAQRVAGLGSWEGDPGTGKVVWSEEMYRIAEIDPAHAGSLSDVSLALAHPDDRASVEKIIGDLGRGVERIELEHRLLMPDGRIKHVLVRGTVIPGAGGRPCMRGTVQDITERKRAEEEQAKLRAQLNQADKMESLGRLAGGVAHDFNNLLTVINGYGSLLLREMSPADPRRKQLEAIGKAGKQAAELTRQLLAFSRQQTLETKLVDLNHVLAELQPMLARLVPANIELQFVLGANAPVCADPHQIGQVVMNLIVNARDAMPVGGRLLIKTGSLERDGSLNESHPAERAGRYVELTVSDTGAGMDERIREKMFDPFFTTKEVGKGTGLGLSMVQGVVEQSGGYITVDSAPGQGTTFHIYLPEAQAAPDSVATDPAGPKADSPIVRGETVLVVEDQDAVRDYVAVALETDGYQVIKAEGGTDAIAIWEKKATGIGLVLTDLMMPGMSGRELANRMRQDRPGVKVLFMSGYFGELTDLREISGESGDIIEKPFSPEQIVAKIREVLAR